MSEIALQMERVSLSFPGLRSPVLQNVNLSISKGEVAGITGQNGSGKTSLCNVICGFVKPCSGCVRLNGRVITTARTGSSLPHSNKMVRRQADPCEIARTFQSRSTIQGVTAWRYVKDKDAEDLAALGTQTGLVEAFFLEPFRSIFSRKYRVMSEEMRQGNLQEFLDLGLDPCIAENSLEKLSLGVRRVLDVLRALNTVRTLFLLDEPFTNLRPQTASLLSGRIRKRASGGLAGLIIDHDRRLLKEVAHRLYELTPSGLMEL